MLKCKITLGWTKMQSASARPRSSIRPLFVARALILMHRITAATLPVLLSQWSWKIKCKVVQTVRRQEFFAESKSCVFGEILANDHRLQVQIAALDKFSRTQIWIASREVGLALLAARCTPRAAAAAHSNEFTEKNKSAISCSN